MAHGRVQVQGRPVETPARDAVDALRAALGERLVAVVLFGSRARGDAHDGSDWDMLVIAEGLPESHFQRHVYLKRLLPPGARGEVSLISRTAAEFEANLPSLYLDIALDGRVLYDPDLYVTQRLATLKRIIRRKGLYREHTPDGDVWRWKKAPVQPWRLEWGA